MSTRPPFHFYDEPALIDRLSNGLKRRPQQVVFLVGAPLSAPRAPDLPGVPDVEGMIELIRCEFEHDGAQLAAFDRQLKESAEQRYQSAFQFLQGRRGQQVANEIVRDAVLHARLPLAEISFDSSSNSDDACRILEADHAGWALSSATESLGLLVVRYPQHFGSCLLTTNFDPLVEVAIGRAGGVCYRTVLHADGNLTQTEASGCHVVHLHGYWYGADTLHTVRQLGHPRPRLKNSLINLLRNKVVVVCGCGGWDDIFTETLIDIVRDDNAYPELLWTFYSSRPEIQESLGQRLEPGLDRGRVSFYSGVDCHRLFPRLYHGWTELESPSTRDTLSQSNPVKPAPMVIERIEAAAVDHVILEGDDEDRPPVVEICVGREPELRTLTETNARAIFINGLGGQGKSTLAARYFTVAQDHAAFSYYVWRDCKEERERFENQLAGVIERLSSGRISGEYLAKQRVEDLVEQLLRLTADIRVLFVFDNVDHYVDLEAGRLLGSPDVLVQALLDSTSRSQVLFTCRPFVRYDHPYSHTSMLKGLTLSATIELFSQRGALSEPHEIEAAHRLTDGHAFWLDLLAIQVTKRASITDLSALINEIQRGGGPLPTKTLNSIWTTLRDREQLVLRAMAETVKPETEVSLGDYLSGQIGYSKVIKALKHLRALNLVVIKQRPGLSDLIELHPLVRQFVRMNFRKEERIPFVQRIILVYGRFIGLHRAELFERPSLSTLEYWSQSAELEIAAGAFDDAFTALSEVADAFLRSGYTREFCRTARMLFGTVNWVEDYAKYGSFEKVFATYVKSLTYLGEYVEVDNLLDKYALTVPKKDVRYISYCDMRSFAQWVRGEFAAAVEWGTKGQALKESSHVDIDEHISHSLALAQRDAGMPEVAIEFFLYGRSLTEITDPDELDEQRHGAYYGNIGRCLHFMGQVDAALVCYQKSALLIERKMSAEHVINQGYIRAWIGELLVAREQPKLAAVFFRAAYLKWMGISPPKAKRVAALLKQIEQKIDGACLVDEQEVENTCLDWIMGHNLDGKFR